jgi:hypothetical protein
MSKGDFRSALMFIGTHACGHCDPTRCMGLLDNSTVDTFLGLCVRSPRQHGREYNLATAARPEQLPRGKNTCDSS